MFREMRRKEKQLSNEAAVNLLQIGEYGVLATADDKGMPYTIPINYAFFDGCIYFHCAEEGHKLDNIKMNSRVSFCVVGDTKILPDKFNTAYQSTVIFGTAHFVENLDEKINALLALVDKYSPAYKKEGEKYIEKAAAETLVVKIHIEHITGKGTTK